MTIIQSLKFLGLEKKTERKNKQIMMKYNISLFYLLFSTTYLECMKKIIQAQVSENKFSLTGARTLKTTASLRSCEYSFYNE